MPRDNLLYDQNTFGFEDCFKLRFIAINLMCKADVIEKFFSGGILD